MHPYSKLWVHIVFSTLDRKPMLSEPLRSDAQRYLAGIARNIGCEPLEIGGYHDHVHCLVRRPPTLTEAEIVNKLKSNSSRWIRQQYPRIRKQFAWQRGYGAFSVSESNAGTVAAYIRRQVEHHRTLTFEEEIRRLFSRHGLEIGVRG